MQDGAYTANRAAALSGVPKGTVHTWARKGLLVPSVSSDRVKLWSYTDLLALRTIYWLRHPKRAPDGVEVPATPMSVVKDALATLRALDAEIFEAGRPSVVVTRDGEVVLRPLGGPAQKPGGQLLLLDSFDVIAPFSSEEGGRGPDLIAPAPFVRILPRRMSGAPHVLDMRIETEALYALALRGFDADRIHALYPEVEMEAIHDALRVERQLAQNLALAA